MPTMLPYDQCPGPGVYEDVPAEVYHRWPYFSNTLGKHMKRSAAHGKAYLDGWVEPTPAFKFGRLGHVAVLEGSKLEELFLPGAPQCRATKGDGTRCGNPAKLMHRELGWVCGVHGKDEEMMVEPDQEIVTLDDWNRATSIRDNVRARKSAAWLSKGASSSEVSVVWDDPETGVRCKARWDRVAPPEVIEGGAIADLKTCQDARAEEFAWDIYRYEYHGQGWLYRTAAEVLGVPARHYAMVPVEKERPWGVNTFLLSDQAIYAGGEIMRPRIQLYAECRASGVWPGYPDIITEISLPEPAWKRHEAWVKAEYEKEMGQ